MKLREYLNKKKFIIPNYQRGYKWSVKEDGKPSAVEVLMDDLINAYSNEYVNYFIQGVTVSESENGICLIDGQQRTTTLYILLWCLNYKGIDSIEIDYEIRKDSKEFLNRLKQKNISLSDLEDFEKNHRHQDIHLFLDAIQQINMKLKKLGDKKQDFLDSFLLDKTDLLYIRDENDSVKTFTMMNGNKASMLNEELIKAELLRQISISDEDSYDENELLLDRSRYARAWDRWLYWWNQVEIQRFYQVTNTPSMGLLLQFYFEKIEGFKDYNFQNFKKLISTKSKAKKVFKQLRDLQKSFEDIYMDPIIHNSLALSLITNKDDKNTILKYFIDNLHDKKNLINYSKWRLVGATHNEIISTDEELIKVKREKAEIIRTNLASDFVYKYYDNEAFKQLLRMNVEEYNKLNSGKGMHFDFSVWNKKSLEHIYPKSKVFHQDVNENGKKIWLTGNNDEVSKTYIDIEINKKTGIYREAFFEGETEHCIGNLVLLYVRNNSEFGNKSFNEKKNIYFNCNDKDFLFESRSLLHSMFIFSNDEWTVEKIHENKTRFLKNFDETYLIEEK